MFSVFRHPVLSDSLWPHGLQHARSPYPPPSPKICSISRPLHPWCHPAISSPDSLFSSPQSFQHQGLFQWVSRSHQVIKILELQLQYQSFQWGFRLPWAAAAAAAAKSLQSCLTLCDPIDGSPPGSPVPGTLQARTLEWVAISFSNAWKWKVKVKPLSH